SAVACAGRVVSVSDFVAETAGPVMSGASLLPVMVIVSSCVSVSALAALSFPYTALFRSSVSPWRRKLKAPSPLDPDVNVQLKFEPAAGSARSEERRVGKESSFRWATHSGMKQLNVLEE